MDPTPPPPLPTSGNFQIARLVSATQLPFGSDIMDVTAPSTGTASDTFCRPVLLHTTIVQQC